MGARIIDGKALAEGLRLEIAGRVGAVKARGGAARLDAVLVGTTDNASRQYAENQAKTCEALGIEYRLHELGEGAGYDEIAGRVLLLNTMETVSAIMVHLPLPEGVEAYRIQKLIAPEKDVEGVNPANIGNIVYGRSSLAPCTGLAAVRMIETTGVSIRGAVAVVVGASDVVGKPIAVMLMRREATVISCNKYTRRGGGAGGMGRMGDGRESEKPEVVIEELTRRADILVAAAGVPRLITAGMVKPGAVVIDVGVNRVAAADGGMKTVGDVDFAGVKDVAGWISPVPGGVGPMTVAMLLQNVVEAGERAPLRV